MSGRKEKEKYEKTFASRLLACLGSNQLIKTAASRAESINPGSSKPLALSLFSHFNWKASIAIFVPIVSQQQEFVVVSIWIAEGLSQPEAASGQILEPPSC